MSDVVRVTVLGAAGRMGQCIVRCANGFAGVRLAGAVECAGHPSLGQDVGILSGAGRCGLAVTSDLAAALAESDVLIDFTVHNAVHANVQAAVRQGTAMVVGTTGLSDCEAEVLRLAAGKVAIVWAPSMSLGVNLLFAFVKKAASVLGADYRIEIDETHHVHKKDAPSGTALRLGRKAADGRGLDAAKVMVHVPEGADARVAEGSIVIRSRRQGEVVGDHTVSFENETERVCFSHSARSRSAFALGALHAARWVVGREPALYDMQDVLGL